MQNKRIVTPLPVLTLLALCWPFANFLDVNKTMLRASQVFDVLAYLNLCIAAAGLFWALLYVLHVSRKVRFALDAASAISIALFFSFPIIMNLIASALAVLGTNNGGFLVYAALLLVAFGISFWAGTKGSARSFLLVFFLIVAALPSFRYTWFETSQAFSKASQQPADGNVVEASFEAKPDVYFLVMDNYARSDFLQRYFDHDNTSFLNALRERGFSVSKDFNSNYPSTFLSLASTLEMDYVATPDVTFDNRDPFVEAIVGGSLVHDTFRSAGYTIAHGSYKVTSAGCQGNEEYCLDKGLATSLGEIEYGLLSLTPIATLLGRVQFYGLPPQTLDQYIEKVSNVPFEKSVFYFIHSNPPHPPFYMTEQCIEGPISAINAREGDQNMKAAYNISVDCAGRGALQFIDDVLAKDSEAVIILQSDHGSSSTVDWRVPATEWTTVQSEERLAALSAIRTPERCNELDGDVKSSVNTFRAVIACLENRAPNFLQDRYFINTYENVNDFGRVHEVFLSEVSAYGSK